MCNPLYSTVTIIYVSVPMQALRIHRRRCLDNVPGAQLTDKAGLLADAFTGNFAHNIGQDLRRAKIAEELNAMLPLEPPGGWSAAGQPCDAWINHFRRACDAHADWCLGFTPDLSTRHGTLGVPMTSKGIPDRELTPEQLLDGLMWAYDQISEAVLESSWITRGWVTKQEMLLMKPHRTASDLDNGIAEANHLEDFMSRTHGF